MALAIFQDTIGQIGAYFSSQQTPATSSTSESHATMSHDEMEDALAEELLQVETDRSSKRVRGRESEEPERKKVKTAPSDHERRSTGDYDTPSTAMPIVPPRSGTSRPNTPRPMAEKTSRATGKTNFGGCFKPVNTLDKAPHTSIRSSGGKPVAFYTGVNATKPLTMKASAGSNVANQKRSYITGQGRVGADGSESAPCVKRQKTRHVNGTVGMSSPVIDLIDDDDNEQSASRAPQARAPHRNNGFNSEMLSADGYSGAFQKPHKPRIRKDRDRSSSKATSESRSEFEVVGSACSSRSSAQPASGHSPAVVVNRHSAGQYALMATPGRRRIDQTGTHGPADMQARPPIKLGAGVDDYKGGLQRDSAESVGRSGAHSDASKSLKQRQQHTDDSENSSRGSDGEPCTLSAYAEMGAQQQALRRQKAAQTASQNARAVFIRDEGSEPPPLKAKQRMQAGARPESRDDTHSDSLDELQGSTTVNSTASRRAMARRGTERPTSSEKAPSSKLRRQTGSTDRSSSRNYGDTRDNNARQLAAFYTLAGNFEGGGLELRYDDSERRLELYENGIPAPLPGQKGIIGLDAGDISTVYACEGVPRVVLQGRQGKTCLAFMDQESIGWFGNCIAAITDHRYNYRSEADDTRYRNVVGIIEDQQKRAEAEAAHQRQRMQMHAKLRAGNEGEDVQYDSSDQDERAPKRRQIVQLDPEKGALTRALRQSQADKVARQALRAQDETVSPYFNGEPRRSSRQSKPVKQRPPNPEPIKWTEVNQPEPWPQPVIYPAQGLRRVTVDFADLQRLDEGDFLNDNVVGFALRQIEENMSPKFKDQVHWFSSFFYTTLSTKNKKKAFNYDGVKRWTKNKDLLSTPYVVVPICQEFHWYVCIICNLDKIRRPLAEIKYGAEEQLPVQKSSAIQANEAKGDEDAVEVVSVAQGVGPEVDSITDGVEKQSLSDRSGNSSLQASMGNVYAFNDDGKAGNAEDRQIKVSTKPAAARKGKKGAPTRTYDPHTPLIITLDSLGLTHAAELRNLKDYVCCEAEAKRGINVEKEALQGLTAKGLPEQTNFCDCGIYVIGYMEQFAQNPASFVAKVASRQLDREDDFASFDPNAKREQIRNSLLVLQREQEDEVQHNMSEKASNSTKAEPQDGADAGQQKSPSPENSPERRPRSMEELLAEGPKVTHSGLQPIQPVVGRVRSFKQSPYEKASPSPPRRITLPATGDDELEMSVPRSLPQSDASSRPTLSAGKPPAKRVGPFEEEDLEEDGMLDPGRDVTSHGLNSSRTRSTAPVGGEPLLNGLEAMNNAGKLTWREGHAAEGDSRTSSKGVSVGPVTPAQRPQAGKRDSEPSVIMIDDSQEGITVGRAEIADSQDQKPERVSTPQTNGKRRHIKFDD